MQGLGTDIVVVHDTDFKPGEVVSALAGHFAVRQEELDGVPGEGASDAHLYVFCASLSSDRTFHRVKNALKGLEGEKLFISRTHHSGANSRLRDLGIEDYLVLPIAATGPWKDCAPAGETKLSRKGPKSP